MSGPYPPYQGGPGQPTDPPQFNANFGQAWGPYRPPEPPRPPFPSPPAGGPFPGPYPDPLPPPLPYPNRRNRKPLIAAGLAALVIIAVVVAVVALGRGGDSRGGAVLTDATAQEAIQGYLDAMSDGDLEAVSRNALCGLYDGVKDRRADDALARLSSDAFQKQFSSAQVTGIDTMVFASPSSAQVLFSMQVVPAAGNRGGSAAGDDERQGVAQVLVQGDEVLVCSYVLRTAGTF